MLPSRKRTQGGASLCPGLSPFAPLGRTDREQARGQRPEARGNSQTAGKLWCDPPQVSKDHDACRFTQNAGTVPGYFLRCALVSIHCSQGDPAYVSLSVLENRPDLGRTVRLGRTIQCSRRATYPGRRFALPWAISFCPFGADGSGAGQRPEGTAKQPENFGAILRRYPRITMHVASRKTRGLSPGIS